MKRKHLIWLISVPIAFLLVSGLLTVFFAYRGTYLGEQQSPDGMFTLHYYKSFNPFRMVWSMPGDTMCTPEWIRLYNRNGDKINELYTTNCKREMEPHWYEDQVILPDGLTTWKLPEHR
jgi:hypothetical protein